MHYKMIYLFLNGLERGALRRGYFLRGEWNLCYFFLLKENVNIQQNLSIFKRGKRRKESFPRLSIVFFTSLLCLFRKTSLSLLRSSLFAYPTLNYLFSLSLAFKMYFVRLFQTYVLFACSLSLSHLYFLLLGEREWVFTCTCMCVSKGVCVISTC